MLGLVLGLLASACGTDSRDCIPPPCAIPLAITLNVTAFAGGAVAGAVVRVSGGVNGTVSCEAGADATTCRIPGAPGTYDLEIAAPGFETAHRSVTVSGTTPECGPEGIAPSAVVKIFEKAGGRAFEVTHVPVEALQAKVAAATDPMEKRWRSTRGAR